MCTHMILVVSCGESGAVFCDGIFSLNFTQLLIVLAPQVDTNDTKTALCYTVSIHRDLV